MGKFQADTRFIASIYPGELEPIALNHGPDAKTGTARRTVYKLRPVEREQARTSPCVITIRDGFENVLNVMGAQMGEKYMAKLVDVDETVANLLRFWTGNMVDVPAGAHPGIIEIANSLPTKAEHERMMEAQTAYFEHGFKEGERLNRENNWKEIKGAWKIGAVWLGRDVLWAVPGKVVDMVPCPACGQTIMPKAFKCFHCGTQLRALPKELAILNQQQPEPEAPLVA